MIYEISAGKELAHLVPNEEEYSFVLNDQCKEILQFIFTRKPDGTFLRTIRNVSGRLSFAHCKNDGLVL